MSLLVDIEFYHQLLWDSNEAALLEISSGIPFDSIEYLFGDENMYTILIALQAADIVTLYQDTITYIKPYFSTDYCNHINFL